ncbi:MAG: FG-GAP-like repeat-containing protein [Gemmatimonadota bacterium]|nr:FG-GAP-like repeat-containing protein [Gemmatimonadota bacterium]
MRSTPPGRVIALAVVFAGCSTGSDAPPATPAEILATRGAAEAFLQQDRLDEAQTEFERLVAMVPSEPAGYAGLGLIALRDGRLDDAGRWLEEAQERAPDDPELTLALGRLSLEAGEPDAARARRAAALEADTTHAKTLWLLAVIEAETAGEGSPAHVERLSAVVTAEPGNLAARLALAAAYLAAGDTDAALAELETFRQLAPDLPPDADVPFASAEEAARSDDAVAAAAALDAFRSRFEVTALYQADMESLRPPQGRLVGIPFLTFSSSDNLTVIEQADVLAALRYADASALSGLADLAATSSGSAAAANAGSAGAPTAGSANPASALAIGDFDLDGDEDALWLNGGTARFLRVDLGQFVDVSDELGGFAAPDATELLFVDLDDDRRLDVYVGGALPSFRRQMPDGTFVAVSAAEAGLAGLAGASGPPPRRTVAADLDHDGDLDLLEVRAGLNRFLRNDGDWTFTEMARTAGLAGPANADTRDVSFADIDDDRDLDLVLAEGDGGVRVLRNLRGGTFEDATAELAGPAAAMPAHAVTLDDVDNDGRPDLIVASSTVVSVHPRHPDVGFAAAAATLDLGGLAPAGLAALDFDNDGWLDLGVAGSGGGGLALFRNDQRGGLEDARRFLPESANTAAIAPGSGAPGSSARGTGDLVRLRPTDYNDDGDSDLILLSAGGEPRLLRNDGGNANHFVRLDLAGLGEGSRKNNRFAIGARVEVRVGDLLQVRTVRTPGLRFGLDGRLKADVVRVEWPNGTAQDLYFPGTDQDLIEQQSLKGSCPLLYVWDGDGFEFVGDVMWKSALGMPLGILGAGERSYAPGYPSQEYRRLPAGILKPRDGEYIMQLTEELWETIYVDDVDLLAVDHPADVEVYVDERFVPPSPTELRLWEVRERHRPVAATDGHGRDHRDALAARDFTYVSSLRPGRFQGIAEPHELILDLGDAARGGDVTLFLTGWIFPTDASINVALAQSDDLEARFPVLDVIGPDGSWTPTIPNVSFPSGKDKTVVLDLAGAFRSDDRHVRIRTNLMIYWDEAFYTVASPRARGTPVTGRAASPFDTSHDGYAVTTLEPIAADLHYRGFSREYRKGGRYGPHWFDYDDVTTAPVWSDLRGRYTRYGDVTELLGSGDDMYVVANAGDEITLRFDANALPQLRDGWDRTFLIYTDGWVKDGDLNTATGDRVGPLPFRAQSIYPYGLDERYPDDAAHRRFLEEYQTREVRSRF